MPNSQRNAMSQRVGRDQWHRRPRLALRRCLLVSAVLFGLVWGTLIDARLVGAQDDWDAAEVPMNQPGPNHFQLPDFDNWAFRGQKPAQIKQLLMARASVRLDSFALTYDLSDAQRKKLELAARGDVRKFFRKAEEVRAKYNEVKNDRQKVNEIVQAIQPIQKTIQAIQKKTQGSFFDDDSLLTKALKSTLSGEQSERYERQQRERRQFNYEAKIEYALIMLESGVPLREQQRKQFVKLLLEETEPPKSFGRQPQYEVFFQVGTLDEEKLRPIFDDAQWRAIRRLLAQAKAMGPNLKRNGFTP